MVRDPRAVEVVPIPHPKGCRSYVVVDPGSREACVVDPLLDQVGETLRALAERGGRLRWVVETHAHGDHLSGAAALRERTGAEVVMHPSARSEVATLRASDGERIPLGEQVLVVRHAPGLTPDALVLEAPGAVFSGDVLLIGTVGLRDAPGSDPDAWFASLRAHLDPLPDETILHPGHDDMGRTASTLRQERTGNRWLRTEDLEAFRALFALDRRPPRRDAAGILEANARGLLRPPRDLEVASGLLAPSRAAEAAALARPSRPLAPPTAAEPLSPRARGLLLLTGAAASAGTILGWGLHPLLHALSGLAGVVLLGAALGAAPRRRRREEAARLLYEGPR